MATDNSNDIASQGLLSQGLLSQGLTEAELFYNYLGQRISQDGREAPVADLFADFQEYCRELDEVRGKLREAEESSARGESKPLNLTSLLERVEKRWDEKGVPE